MPAAGMFLATTLLYPCVLAALCFGAGLLVDRIAGGWLHPALLPVVGVAALIGVSQISTMPFWLAPATPWLLLGVGVVGLAVGRRRAGEVLAAVARRPLLPAVAVLAYVIALAPVLLAGRPSFSSYGVLTDSAIHMVGADYLIHHGQSYSGLDLTNAYGLLVKNYYGTSYPSGADTVFGASALLLGLPLIWAFQPFNAFVLALACGPVWLLLRRLGLDRRWAGAAALTAVLPALVYAYELFGSIKEITTLPLLLSCGWLAADYRRWLFRGARGVVPLALLFAGGLSALGAAFGAWAAATTIAIVATVLADRRREDVQDLPVVALLVGLAIVVLAALPTWRNIGGSLDVAGAIASTSNSGNLSEPLKTVQVLGIWLHGSYKIAPKGADASLTDGLIVLAALAGALGIWQVLRRRAWSLGCWVAMMLLTWLAISQIVTTWAGAKTLVLTSPLVMVLVWGGVACLTGMRRRTVRIAGALAGLALLAGVAVSDKLQYDSSDLAPTARYDELARIGERFAGRGPTLFTDFDEYAMYELRGMDVGAADFIYSSPRLESAAGGHGTPVTLEAVRPQALAHYALIVTRRNPSEPRPPADYQLVWQGRYYQVWKRSPRSQTTVGEVTLSGAASRSDCSQILSLAGTAPFGDVLTGSLAPTLVRVPIERSRHPGGWARLRGGLVMSSDGTMRSGFWVGRTGRWQLWLQGDFMPPTTVRIDGRRVARLAGELSGNSLVTAPAPPLQVTLANGFHRISVTRESSPLAPGSSGTAVLHAAFLTPAGAPPQGRLLTVPVARAGALCSRRLQWVELQQRRQASPVA